MPRAKKPPTPAAPYPTGNPTPQAPSAPTGMPYGEHGASIESQRQAPMAGSPLGAASGPAPAPGPGPDAILGAASQYQHVPVPLTAPPTSPEPLSTGLPGGPGAGPEVMPMARNGTADALELLANTTGDPLFAQLAQRARLRQRRQ